MNERTSPPSHTSHHRPASRWLAALALGISTVATAGCALSEEPTELETELDDDATSRRGLFQTLHGLQEHRYIERDGRFIIQGDVVVDAPLSEEEAEASFRGASYLENSNYSLWPNGQVDFEIAPGFSPAQEANIRAAIVHWEQLTPIRFTEEVGGHLRFVPNGTPSTCQSTIGRYEHPIVPSIPQDIDLGGWCGFGAIVHEIGHAVGLAHEHNRSDRNDYITLVDDLENLPQLCQDNFEVPVGIEDLGPYDFDSIMHYGPSDCAGYPMFTRNDGLPFVHNTSGLSQGDREAVMELYAAELGYGFEPATRWNRNWSVGDGWLAADHPRMLADVTGEGRDDLVGFHEDGVWVSKSNGSKFWPKNKWLDGAFGNGPAGGSWDPVQNPRVLVDVNADGRADIVGFADDGVWISESEPGGFTTPHFAGAHFGGGVTAGGWDSTRHIREVRDLDGDGNLEIIGFGETGVYVSTLYPTQWDGVGHEYEMILPPTEWIVGFGAAVAGGGWTIGTHPRLIDDVDGDGDLDLIGFGQAAVYVAYNTGSAFVGAWTYGDDFSAADHFTAMNGWTAGHPRVLADINGDNQADVVGFGAAGVVVSLSRGSYFDAPQLWASGYITSPPYAVADGRVVDIDGDGRDDLVGFGLSGIVVTPSDAGWFPPTIELGFPELWSLDFATPSGLLPAEHLRLLGDVDGDGSTDIVQIDDTQVNVIVND